jgi:4-amino-4-deoxy-L-arabinose transferase-like glycosyltransferase
VPDRLGWRAGILLAAFALVLFLPGFFTLPPVDRDEARFAQATRQMLESNDYVDIRFQESTRYKKPIGIYWLQAASVRTWRAIVGEETARGIWPYRFPSLVAAVSSVVLTGAIGAVLFGRNIGIVGALLIAMTMVLNLEARIATTDATLLLSVLSAQYALARARFEKNEAAMPALPLGVAIPCWLGFALGILVKGPIVVLVAAGTMAGLLWQRSGARWLLRVRPLLGLFLTCAVVVPWLVLITLRTQGAFFQDSVGQDLLGKLFDAETAGRLPPGMHVLMLWLGFWPGSLIVVLALPWMWASRRDAAVGFCLAWAIPTWILFELPMTKLIHYVLPAYPALALMAAAWLVQRGEQQWPRYLRSAAVVGWSVLSLGICGAVIALPLLLDGHVMMAPAILSLMAAVLLMIGAANIIRDRYRAFVATAIAAPIFFVAAGMMLPNLQRPFTSRTIAAMLPGLSPCPNPDLASAGYDEPSLVFLTTTSIRLMTGPALADFLASSNCAVAFLEKREEQWFYERARQLGSGPQPVATIEGINSANSRRVVLKVFVRAPEASPARKN